MGEFYDFEESGRMSMASHRRYDRNQEARNRVDQNLGNIKMKIPVFQGRSDPEAYLKWERKMELGEYPIENWDEMKKVMRGRYVPRHYYRDLYLKLQGLYQGNRSVYDYNKEMEMAMIRANVKEDRDATMARFFNGLNREITNAIEIYINDYVELEDLVDMAITVERQLKRSGTSPRPQNSSTTPWRSSYPNKEETSSTFKAKREPKTGIGHIASQCPNKQVMMIQENVEIDSEDEADLDSMPPLEDAPSRVEELREDNGDMLELVAQGALSLTAKEEEVEVLRKNIFHTHCHVKEEVVVPLQIDKYEDEVLCDVVPIQVGHLLLGRSRQFDKCVQHDGFTNKYSFKLNQKSITLFLMTPKQVYEYQVRVQQLRKIDHGEDLRTNPSQEGGNDKDQGWFYTVILWDPPWSHKLVGPTHKGWFYTVILWDPPWRYKLVGPTKRSRGTHKDNHV
ncbi:uncharacterized protein [Aristolochia californica]|uniref:uncharacterized protein n=1 Tax=Aristolochia californica TaxID=171875 RepID=UPI0035E2223B